MNLVFRESECSSKEEVLKKIASLVKIADEDEILEGLKKRETEISTGLVDEIAIPHAMINCEEATIVVLKNNVSIKEWETIDGSEVKYIISIIAPNNNVDHLKILTEISKKLMNEDTVLKLKNCSNENELKEILI